MRYTFELSYHHNNPTPSVRLSVVASNEEEAYRKAFIRGIEHQNGTNFGITEEDLRPLFASNDEEHIIKRKKWGEKIFLHVWRTYEQVSQPQADYWNIGFGLGGEAPRSTDKYENAWLELVTTHPPKTKKELVQAIEGLVYDIGKLNKQKLECTYQYLLEKMNQ